MGLFSSLFGGTKIPDAIQVDVTKEAGKALNWNKKVAGETDTMSSIASFFSGMYDDLLSGEAKQLEANSVSNALALQKGDLPEDWLQNVLRSSAELYGGTGGTTGALGTQFGTRQSSNYFKNLVGGSVGLMQYGENLASNLASRYEARASTGINAASNWMNANLMTPAQAASVAVQNASAQNQVNQQNIAMANANSPLNVIGNLLGTVGGGIISGMTGGISTVAGLGIGNSLFGSLLNNQTQNKNQNMFNLSNAASGNNWLNPNFSFNSLL